MNTYEVLILTAVMSGAVCAWIAKSKGRSPVLWFGIGAALNILVIAGILIYGARQESRGKLGNR